jgi:hypothetical protein
MAIGQQPTDSFSAAEVTGPRRASGAMRLVGGGVDKRTHTASSTLANAVASFTRRSAMAVRVRVEPTDSLADTDVTLFISGEIPCRGL